MDQLVPEKDSLFRDKDNGTTIIIISSRYALWTKTDMDLLSRISSFIISYFCLALCSSV